MAPLLKSLNQLRKDPIQFFSGLAAEQGPIAEIELGPNHLFLINEPGIIREVLVNQAAKFEKFPRLKRDAGLFGEGLLTSEGDFHLRQRRLAQPAFHWDRILGYGREMVECASSLSQHWRDGQVADIAEDMSALALDIVHRALFRVEASASAEHVSKDLSTVLRGLNTLVMPLGSLLLALPTPAAHRYRSALRRLDQVIYQVITHHRESGIDHGDLLSMFLNSEDELGTGRMNNLQLRDEVMTMFVAGHETVANALAWAFWLMANHPEHQDNIAAEVKAVCGSSLPSPEDTSKLEYTRRVFAESMRLYPPVWILGRRPLQEFEHAGFKAPKGSIILVCMFVLHRQHNLWQRPTQFEPDRWATQPDKFAFLPFGAGQRICIGERFAWMEGILTLATLVSRWRFTPLPNQIVQPQGLLTLRPAGGLHLKLQKREMNS